MKHILVTGAGGFLGRYVVEAALSRGHTVRALVRPGSPGAHMIGGGRTGVEVVERDMACSSLVDPALWHRVDAVVHLAAGKTGDYTARHRNTVVATERLCEAMEASGMRRLVTIGSLCVYDYLRLPSYALLDEDAPIERYPEARDEYARVKLLQDQVVRRFQASGHGEIVVLHPGIIYGAGQLWNARLGLRLHRRLWLRTGSRALLPLVYVEHCAEAIVRAVECPQAGGQTIHLLDDALPTQRAYMAELARREPVRPVIIPLAWWLLRGLARMTFLATGFAPGLRERVVPSLLLPARLHARCKPLRYGNERMKRVLGFQPRYSLAEALDRSQSSGSIRSNEESSVRGES